MRYKKKVQRVVEERIARSRTVCDLCQEQITDRFDRRGSGKIDWDDSEVTIEAALGDRYPDDADCRTFYEVDICPTCFIEKVVPALAGLGAKVRVREASADSEVLEPEGTP